mgnify:CR=1 FL=1
MMNSPSSPTDILIGKAYSDMGRGPDSYDCWGVCVEVGKILGIPIPDYGEYHCSESDRVFKNFLDKSVMEWDKIKGKPQPGDVLVFKQETKNSCLHFGIVVEDGRHFLQCNRDLGVHRARLNNPYFKQAVLGIYRFRGAE